MAGSRSAASELAPAAEPRRVAKAERAGRALAVTILRASRTSLGAVFRERVPDGAEFEALEVEGDPAVRLGRCRFSAEGGAEDERVGRLVFLDGVYDCGALVDEGRVLDLATPLQSVPLVVQQRDRVRPEFKEFCANVVYDVSVYKRFFDEQDALLEGEPQDALEAAHGALIASEGRRFVEFLREKERELERLVRGYSEEEHERHGFFLRRLAWPHILTSEIHRRTNLKPRGYAGDAEMMQLIYENAYAGRTLFGKLLHKYAVEMPGADAVRARRALVARVLREVRDRAASARPFRFLSMACGPALELEDIFLGPADVRDLECTLVDQDALALEFARRTVAGVQAARGLAIRAAFVNDSVRTMLRDRRLVERLGSFHFIYSMGLFDYLTPPVARSVLAMMYGLLAPGGTLSVGNYHVSNASRTYMTYWLDWPLFLRTERAFGELADGLPGARVEIAFDASGCQMFLRVEKGC
jgi:extracellular factor (EF) 3-hydroxypalmitic acid methyl ester biosynthesis protein